MRQFDQDLMAAVARLGGNAYGFTIRKEIGDVSLGRIYTGLNRLEREGLVSSYMGGATSERGWRRKKFYKIVPLS